MKTLVLPHEELISAATNHVVRLLQRKPEAVIALSASEPCLSLCHALSAKQREGVLSLRSARFFSITEFEGLSPEGGHGRGRRLKSFFAENTDADMSRFTVLSEENLDSYDELIRQAGGLDLAIPELGGNSRVGFNEPATPFDTRTHRQKLTNPTRRELAEDFGGEEQVPVYGLTMGIKTLVEAGELLILAEGEEKARAVFHMLYARDDSIYPAAFLQIPLQVTVLVDEAAAAKL